MSKIARRRIEASNPYTPTPRPTFDHPLEAADEALDDLRLALRVHEADGADRHANHVALRSIEVIADAMAQLEREKGGAS